MEIEFTVKVKADSSITDDMLDEFLEICDKHNFYQVSTVDGEYIDGAGTLDKDSAAWVLDVAALEWTGWVSILEINDDDEEGDDGEEA